MSLNLKFVLLLGSSSKIIVGFSGGSDWSFEGSINDFTVEVVFTNKGIIDSSVLFDPIGFVKIRYSSEN